MGALDTAKSVVSLAAEVNRMDLYKQAVELMAQVTEQQQDIMRLSEEAAALSEQLRLRKSFTFTANAYWQGDPHSAADDYTLAGMGPYCSRCFDVLDRAVRMHDTHQTSPKAGRIYRCPECGRSTGAPPAGRAGVVPAP